MGTPAKVLEPMAVRRLFSYVQSRPDATRERVIVLLSFNAGLRACEIAGLSWPMVLRPGGGIGEQLNVAGTIAKNGSGRRVPLTRELRQALGTLWRESGKPLIGPVVRSLRCDLRGREVVALRFDCHVDQVVRRRPSRIDTVWQRWRLSISPSACGGG